MPEPDFKDPVLELDTTPAPTVGIETVEQKEERAISAGQVGFAENVELGFKRDTALSASIEIIDDESEGIYNDLIPEEFQEELQETADVASGLTQMSTISASFGMALMGFREDETTEWDKAAHYEKLTEGLPFNYDEDIMGEPTVEAAYRRRKRIMDKLSVKQKAAIQRDGDVGQFFGGFIDYDLALIMGSGGSLAMTKAGAGLVKGVRSRRLAGAVKGAIDGAEEGAIAGAMVAGGRKAWDDTVGWEDAATQLLLSTAAGGVLGGGLGAALPSPVHVQDSILQAQDELATRIATNDPSMTATVDPESMPPAGAPIGPSASLLEPEVLRANKAAGAQGVTPGPEDFRSAPIDDPAGNTSETAQAWMDGADDWLHASGWGVQKEIDLDDGFVKLTSHMPQVLVGNSFYTSIYKSQSSLNNWLAGTVYESGSGMGRGRATASSRMENYQRRMGQHTFDVPRFAHGWAASNGMSFGHKKSKKGISKEGAAEFNRRIMLERNARDYSYERTTDPDIKAAADAYDNLATESLSILKGRDGELSVDGTKGIKENPHYTPYKWLGRKMLELIENGTTTRKMIVAGLANSYRKVGINKKDVEAIADAVVTRAVKNDLDIDTSVAALLNRDGQEFLNEALEKAGMPEHERKAMMRRLVGDLKEGKKEGFAKQRNNLDLSDSIETLDGSDLKIVDVLSNDLETDFNRYGRRVAGSSALARVGIINRAQREEVISAAQAQARAKGEAPIDANEYRAMFSNFDGQGIKGYNSLIGGDPATAGIGIAIMKRMTNLALLGKLVITQLGETGAIINQNGLHNFWERGPKAWFDKAAKEDRKGLLDDLSFFSGQIGYDEKIFAEHLSLDEFNALERNQWVDMVDKWSGKASQAQQALTGFNAVRRFQQKAAAAGVTDKIFRVLKDDLDGTVPIDERRLRRFQSDLGLGKDELRKLQNLIKDGTIEFAPNGGGGSFVNRLNGHKWTDVTLIETFGSSIGRNINQLVQKSMAGEADPWMADAVGQMLTHLKTFPMAAYNKQFVRNMRMRDPEAVTGVLWGMATSYMAVNLRQLSKGEDADFDVKKNLRTAFEYSNMTGWAPFYFDPLMVTLGLEGAAISPYADRAKLLTPVAVDHTEDLLRSAGAVKNWAMGEADWQDEQRIKALPFSNLLGWSYMLSKVHD